MCNQHVSFIYLSLSWYFQHRVPYDINVRAGEPWAPIIVTRSIFNGDFLAVDIFCLERKISRF